MDRRKPLLIFRQCEHELPVLVEEFEGNRKIARCLRCGQSGPTVLGGAEKALQALRKQAPWQEAQSA